MALKRLLPRVFRRRMIETRRQRHRDRLFQRRLEELKELKWRYDDWLAVWVSRHDRDARRR